MENQPKQPVTGEEKEIDLGVLFNILGRVFNSIATGVKSFLYWILDGVILFLLFLKRRLLLVIIGLMLSLVPGLYNYLTKGNQYCSTMTVRANFGSVHDLYNKIDYFNALLKLGDNKKLAELFHLPETEVARLDRFEIAPVNEEMQITELYRHVYEGEGIEPGNPADTNWLKIEKYADFKKKLTDYDFPLQQISLYSRLSDYSHIGEGLTAVVSGTPSLKERKLVEDSIIHEETNLVLGSLSGSDTLIKAFSRKIADGGRAEAPGLSLSPQPTHSAEVELFDKQRDLRLALSNVRRTGENQQDILEIVSDFNATGMPISPFKESFLQYSLWCLLGTILVLLLFEGYLKLGELEKQRRNAKGI